MMTRVMAGIVMSCMLAGCVVTRTTPGAKAPPGQVKKATGSKSAKPYAPGQQKKKH